MDDREVDQDIKLSREKGHSGRACHAARGMLDLHTD